MSIGEVARAQGVATSTIRYYEEIGLLASPRRVNGRRAYDRTVQEPLAVISLAKEAGFTLAETKVLLLGAGRHRTRKSRWQQLAQRKLVELDATIAEAQQMQALLRDALECDCTRRDSCRLLARGADSP
jgi:MerR family redox-sensitive transcriptional activator SoxR